MIAWGAQLPGDVARRLYRDFIFPSVLEELRTRPLRPDTYYVGDFADVFVFTVITSSSGPFGRLLLPHSIFVRLCRFQTTLNRDLGCARCPRLALQDALNAMYAADLEDLYENDDA
jgi:hypothetical protein